MEYPVESFVFYRSFFEAMQEMSDADQLDMFRAICSYALYGEEPKLNSAISRAVFSVCRPSIDSNKRKRENGKKGGRPKGNGNKEPEEDKKPEAIGNEQENQWFSNKKTSGFESVNQRFPKAESTETETETVADTESVTDTVTMTETKNVVTVVPEFERVVQEYKKRISRTMTDTSMERLRYYVDRMDAGCCIKAFDEAIDKGQQNWSYVNGVLKNKLEQGVHTVQDWERAERRRTQTEQRDGLPFLK